MIENRQAKDKVLRMGSRPEEPLEQLPYRVELWRDGKVERVLARACSAPLAQAMFSAAIVEHPERRITLKKGQRLIADSAK